MKSKRSAARLAPQASQELCSMLLLEERQYRRLLRLAWRQNSYLRRQDVDRLAKNTQEWQKYLPRAVSARRQRETWVDRLGRELGLSAARVATSDLCSFADQRAGSQVRSAVADVRRVAARLMRQNELNRQLAEFCHELTAEESEIFRRSVLDDPAGCYGDDARKTSSGPGGVLTKQA